MNSTRVQSDVVDRVQESKGQLEVEIRKLLHEVSRVAERALENAREAKRRALRRWKRSSVACAPGKTRFKCCWRAEEIHEGAVRIRDASDCSEGGRVLLLSERFVFELADTAAVLGDDVTVSAEFVLVGG